MTTMTTNVEYSFTIKDNMKPVIILDNTKEQVELNSTSTTSTNSPIISTTELLNFSTCPCNELISSSYDCSDCGQTDSFDAIKDIGIEFDATRNRSREIKNQYNDIRHEREKLDIDYNNLKSNLIQKQQDMETTTHNIESLTLDLKILKSKCKEEVSQVKSIQESKLNVEMELCELTEKLKQEANKLIDIEKREQFDLLQKNSILTQEIGTATKELIEITDELKLIKSKIESKEDQPIKEEDDDNNNHQSIDIYTRSQVELILMHGLDLGIYMDTLEDDSVLMEFNDFIQLLYKTPLRKLNGSKYMKYCIKEDIDPCLRFGPNPRLASKKIIDSILVKSCFIEECPEGFVDEQSSRLLKEEATATMWERFTTSSVFIGCQACGRHTDDLKYRFRISYFDEWACIDRYCRDRLLAVVEFYTFIRHLRAGAYKHRSLHELYQQSLRLKLQMFIAR